MTTPQESQPLNPSNPTSAEGVEDNNRQSKRKKAMAYTALGAFLAGGLVFTGIRAAGSDNEPPDVEPTATATAEPTAEPDPTETAEPTPEPSVILPGEREPLFDTTEGFSVEKYTSPEDLARAFDEAAVTEWFNAGATSENNDAWIKSGMTMEDYATMIAEEHDQRYLEAFLPADWESRPEISPWVENMKRIHRDTVELNFITRDTIGANPEDKEPYYRGSELVNIVELSQPSDNEIIMTVDSRDYDNARMNRVGEELTGGHQVRGETGRSILKWENINNRWILVSMQYLGEV